MVTLRECSGWAEVATLRGMERERIRPAVTADVPAVKAVTDAAYRPYVERIGVVPQPMEADHAANVAAGRVFVTEEPGTGLAGPVGLVVLEAHADHLFLDSIAVHPDAHGGEWGGGCCGSWTRTRVRWACPRSGSTRTP